LSGLPELDVNIESVTAADGLQIPVNTYVPRGATGKLPVLVMVHGGPAASTTLGYSPGVRFYTAHGFAVVAPNVRGSTGFGRAYEQADDGPKRLDALKDIEAVARWTQGRAWADPTRLVIFGGSYGGYMVLMGMTRQPHIWRAGVDLVGPSNWRSFMATTRGEIREVLSKEFGSVEKDGAFLDSISPLRDIEKVKSPLFVFQGKNDPRVPQSESDQIVISLRKRGIPVEYLVAPDEGHSLDRRPNQVAFTARTTLFLKKHLEMR
jgi:dipeptidyl aminopeptidase/acylaminoacyl peptidase